MSFYKNIELYKDNIALLDDCNTKITYEKLGLLSDEFSKKLGKGRKLVMVFCENVTSSVIGYLGCLRNDHIPILIDSNIDSNLAKNLIDIYKPNFLWMPEEVSINFSEYTIISEGKEYVLINTNFNMKHKIYDKLAMLLTTSGSTGSPKLVRQSKLNIQSNAESIATYLEITDKEKPITTLPMNYTYGLSVINSHLLKGATILLTNKSIFEREFWQFFKKNNATSLSGVPYTYEMLNKMRFSRMDLSSLKTLTQAGGKLNYDLTKQINDYCKEKKIKFFVMYGQTEATARMGYLPYKHAEGKCGSMGIAIPGGEFWLENNGIKVLDNEVPAELIYKGHNVTLGYAECLEDLSLGDINKGILKTGDIAKRDKDGFYYIVGRKKRFIKLFGNRVNLDEIEQLLKKSGYECACGGKDDKMIIAVVGCKDEEKIKEGLASTIKFSKTAFSIINVEEIPKNESGKILYSKLFGGM